MYNKEVVVVEGKIYVVVGYFDGVGFKIGVGGEYVDIRYGLVWSFECCVFCNFYNVFGKM